MKRLITAMLLLSVLLGGCSTDKNNGEAKNNNSNMEQDDNVQLKEETFVKENYENFPEVKNIVNYLKEPSKDVKILEQTNKSLVFCLPVKEESESDLSVENYVKILENDGYMLEILDGTISSTFVLKKENNEIKITSISQIEEWKEANKNVYNTKNMSLENLVYEVSEK